MILLDTSFLVAFEVDMDSNHEKASNLMDKIIRNEFGTALLSDYIFDETVTVTFHKTKKLNSAIKAGTSIRNSFGIEKINDKDFDETWVLFRNQKSTKLSFTDCTNLAVMKRMNIRNIATFDEEFTRINNVNVVD